MKAYEVPVVDYAGEKTQEKVDTTQGYILQRKIVKLIKSVVDKQKFIDMKSLGNPKQKKIMKRIYSHTALIQEFEYSITDVDKVSRLESIYNNLSEDSSPKMLLDTLYLIHVSKKGKTKKDV